MYLFKFDLTSENILMKHFFFSCFCGTSHVLLTSGKRVEGGWCTNAIWSSQHVASGCL